MNDLLEFGSESLGVGAGVLSLLLGDVGLRLLNASLRARKGTTTWWCTPQMSRWSNSIRGCGSQLWVRVAAEGGRRGDGRGGDGVDARGGICAGHD